ncbi:MAG: hypothetical protein DMD81_11895 [Candidatus Rokuibacteriota bacterium]|nr:MAG: hypothetical protein DMD81_11895 [Candidatus Rokubacteria bacterium]
MTTWVRYLARAVRTCYPGFMETDRRESTVGSFDHHDSSGVDVSLLRWMLRRSPLERLVLMEQHAQETLTLLEYGRKHRQAKAARLR